MNDAPDQLLASHGIDEADLIDLADGHLSREREGAVLAALKAEPRLGTLVKRLRDDQALVASLGEVRAPADLAEGIEARLEAAALRDLAMASTSAAVEKIPVSQVVVREPGPIRLLLENVWTRRLAAAASVALVAALGVIGIRHIAKSAGHSSTNNTIATTQPAGAPDAQPGHPDAPTHTEVANAKTNSAADAPTPAPVAVAADAPAPEAITPVRAAALASEGRLAIIVNARVAQPALKRLESLARASASEGWRSVALDSPAQYAMLTSPLPATPGVGPSRPSPAPTVIASDKPGVPTAIHADTQPAPALPAPVRVVKALFTVEVGPGEKDIDAIVRLIGEGQADGVGVSLRELPRAIPAGVSVDPDSVMWWNGGPGKWMRRATVPVVFETLE